MFDKRVLNNYLLARKRIQMLSKYLTTESKKIIDLIEAIEQKPVENRFANMTKKIYVTCK